MRRDVLQGAGSGQCSFLQPGVHLFNMFEPLLEFADPQPEGADFLRDGLEVFQGQEMIGCGLAVVKSATGEDAAEQVGQAAVDGARDPAAAPLQRVK